MEHLNESFLLYDLSNKTDHKALRKSENPFSNP